MRFKIIKYSYFEFSLVELNANVEKPEDSKKTEKSENQNQETLNSEQESPKAEEIEDPGKAVFHFIF